MERNFVKRMAACLAALLLVTAVMTGCGGNPPEPAPGEKALTVSSAAFREGDSIPAKYTCDGDDVSPQIGWGEPPAGTASLALVMDDLDAPLGVFTHWVVYNIPSTARELAEAIPANPQLSDGTLQGKNSFRKTGYGGPCPPGGTHRYEFTVYAVDITLDLKAEASKGDVLAAMERHILARGTLTGNYGE